MNIIISANHFELSDSLKSYVEEKVGTLKKYFDNIIEVKVLLDIEKYRNIAEITLHGNNITLVSKEISDDMYSSVSKAVNKMSTQLKKYKEKIKNKKEKVATKDIFAKEIVSPEEPEKYDNVSVEIYSPKAMMIDEAIAYLETNEKNLIAFNDVASNEINILLKKEDNKYHLVKLSKEE